MLLFREYQNQDKKKKKKSESDVIERQYEKARQHAAGTEPSVKHLLPIKTQKGVIARTVDVEEEDGK